MIRRPPRSTRTDTLFPYTTRFRSIDIVTVLAQDAIQAVREAVAEHLKSSPYLPRHVALSLAHDVATVAVPVLRCTSVLHDEDLLAVIQDRKSTRLNSSH